MPKLASTPTIHAASTPEIPQIRIGRVRLLEHDAEPPAWNMAVDEAILDAVVAGLAPPTIRLYRWSVNSVSLGRHQNAKRDIDLEYCRSAVIPLVRRPTGGRAILHGGDLCVSWILPTAQLGTFGRRVGESYRILSAPFVDLLNRLDIPAEFGRCTEDRPRSGDCFQTRSQADVISQEWGKIVGSAQVRRHHVLLQQSSVMHRPADADTSRIFKGSVDTPVHPLAGIDTTELEENLLDSIVSALHATLISDTLTQWELERAAALMESASRVDSPKAV